MRFKRNLPIVAVLVIFLATTLSTRAPVSALSNNAPDPGDYTAGSGVHLIVSRGGPTNGLYAETSDVIVYATSPTVDLSFHGTRSQCGIPPDSNGYAGTDFTVQRGPNPTGPIIANIDGDAAGCGTHTITRTNTTATNIGSSTFYVFFIRARLKASAADAVNGFKISSSSGIIGFYSGSGSQFALQDRTGPASSLSDFNLKFAQDCSVSGSTQRIRIRWKDDDNGAGNQPLSANLRMIVREYDRGTGAYTGRELFMNNNGSNNFLATSGWVGDERNNSAGAGFADFNIDKDKKYEWIWQNVRRTNGIQFEIPKNSINYNVECVPPVVPPVVPPDPKPYIRVYGNDVVAGGGYDTGTGCVPNAGSTVEGYGRYLSSPGSHATYVGAGSELAVFSPGVIEQFLPGSSVTGARNRLWGLSFANNVPGNNAPGTLRFGGGFAQPICANPFPAVLAGPSSGAGPVNIGTLADGEHKFSGNLVINGGAIPNGRRIVIVAVGDVTINGNITYANSSWNDTADIPLLRVYARGDLKIDHSVSTITGVFYSGESGSGQIWTCTDGATVLTPEPATVDAMADLCDDTKLTVFGALIGGKTNFYRTTGDIESAAVGEPYTSANIAEVIVFSPEVYLALLAEQGLPTISVDRVDAIRSLPPAF